MAEEEIKKLLEAVASGEITPDKAHKELKESFVSDLGFAKLDLHRVKRKGFPEVVYCPGKSPEEIKKIFLKLSEHPGNILATRASREVFEKVAEALPAAGYSEPARMIYLIKEKKKPVGLVLVISAGTADVPVAEEAALTAEIMGSKVERVFDVGVAGLHRLLSFKDKIEKANAIVVAAGMEGALPSLVAGLSPCPVIGVPTSVGYGASFAGVTPLLSMLNSCAEGLAVVNIDNGFGAGYMASLINLKAGQK